MNRRQFCEAVVAANVVGVSVGGVASAQQNPELPWQQGVAVYYSDNKFQPGLATKQAQQQAQAWKAEQVAISSFVNRMHGLNVNSLCLTFPLFTSGWQASDIGPDHQFTPDVRQLRYFGQQAHQLGMSVMLKPQLDEASITATGPSGSWRGTIQPQQPSRWFENLTQVLAAYVPLMTDGLADWLVIGTELNSMENSAFDSQWRDLIGQLRRASPAPIRLLYSQNWDVAVGQQIPAWFDQLDAVGIDAYFPIGGLGDDASVDQVAAGLSDYSYVPQGIKQQLPNILIFYTEVGVASMATGPDGRSVFEAPWQWGGPDGGPPDMRVQEVYVGAAYQTYHSWHKSGLAAGMYLWREGIYPLSKPLADNSHGLNGKPAEQTIKQYFSQNPG